MSVEDNDQAWHDTQLLMTRVTAAAASAGKEKELADLIAKYGSAQNVPREELAAYLGPMAEVAKMIRLTATIQEVSEWFGMDYLETQVARAAGAFIQSKCRDIEIYDILDKLFKGPDEDIRPGIVSLMIKLEDITQAQIDAKNSDPDTRLRWCRWMDGDLFKRGPNGAFDL